jgi:P4 family phage/plasmid primase-like protien
MKDYMWDHLASILLGGNQHQKLHMYNGKGSNGKSVLMDLMSQVLGEYKTDAPLSLFTQPRQKQGSASPDIVALKGCRLFLMNEPCDGDVLYEGPMKEYTSCVEPLKGRNLFGNYITFIPQGQFIICTNTLLKVKATDHGTWRRINAVEFVSHFCDNPEKDNEDKPHQFKADSTLVEEKFPRWREVFMSMLVERVFNTQGKVKECKMVTDYSNKYKEREDVISEYISDRILVDKSDKTKMIKKTELSLDFKQWYETNYGRQGQPNIKKLHDHFNKAFGDYKSSISGWSNVKIVYHKENTQNNSSEEVVEYDDDEPDDTDL